MVDITQEDFNDELEMHNAKIECPEVLDKMRLLCQLYYLDAEEIANQWAAFNHTSKLPMPLTVESLDMLESKNLCKKGGKTIKRATIPDKIVSKTVDLDAADELLGAYCSTPQGKGLGNKRQHTPEQIQNKRLANLGRSPLTAAPFSPTSFSPSSATPSVKYGSRSNAGEVVVKFGACTKAVWKSDRQSPCTVSIFDKTTSLTESFKYMFQKLTDKAHVLNDQIEDMAEKLKHHYKIEDFSHVALPSQEEVSLVGRICCDSNGKLNSKSVLLEGSRGISAGKQIPVDLTDVPQYSLFPGQVVAMNGINTTGQKFVAKKVFDGLPLPLPEKTTLENGAVTLVVAAGPFTTSDSSTYEPLTDLITYLQKDPPDVCILMGPFVDAKNTELEKSLRNKTYDSFFKETVQNLLNSTHRAGTHIVLVPSQRDVHHDFVYPQPPFNVPPPITPNSRLHLVSDPCTLLIDGLAVGITSTDVLFHLGTEEISGLPGGPDRLSRLVHHILSQQTYYPLYPCSEEVNIDYDQYENGARLPVTPHILLTPSDLRYFVKDVAGCCCINPGRLAKGQVGGTYSRLRVRQPSSNTTSLVQDIAAQILRI